MESPFESPSISEAPLKERSRFLNKIKDVVSLSLRDEECVGFLLTDFFRDGGCLTIEGDFPNGDFACGEITLSVVPNSDFDREDGFKFFFFTEELTETEEDGFSNEDVELPELEAFPYSDIAEGEISLSEVLPNGDDTEDEFASISKTDWLRTSELDDFLNEGVEVLDLNTSLYVDLVEEDLPNGDGIEDGFAAFFFPSRLANGKGIDGDSTGDWF